MNTKLTQTEKELLRSLIYYILKTKLPQQKTDEFIKILEKKEDSNMKWVERLCNAFDEKYEEGKNQGISQGISQGILNVAKNMLKDNVKIEDIKKFTGLSKKEIQDLKLQC